MLVQPGLKISCNGRDGTVGLIVKKLDEPNKRFLLSCYHVLDGGSGSSDVEGPDGNIIARYANQNGYRHMGLDAAIAEIVSEDVSNQIINSETTITKSAYWNVNDILTKTGATTGVTQCKIVQSLSSYGDLEDAIKLGQYEHEQLYCAEGDSGSLWYSQHNEAIALHARGGIDGNYAAAAPIKIIQSEMNLEII